jgi:hypothetical protein
VGFHFIMLFSSWISCSSSHGSLSSSSCDKAFEACGVPGWPSPSGVEAALAFAFFRGGIAIVRRVCE